MFREFNIVNSYTLECSLCGPSYGARKDYHYSRKMLLVSCFSLNNAFQDMGKQFCIALVDMTDQAKCKMILKELQFKY